MRRAAAGGTAFRAMVLVAAAMIAATCGGGGGDDPASDGFAVDGSVVFTRGPDVVLQRDGQESVTLLAGDDEHSFLAPQFSPAGDEVAYIAFTQELGLDGAVHSDLRVTTLDGADRPLRLHEGRGEFFWTPRWSDDGRSIVYGHQIPAAGGGADFTVELVDSDAGDVRTIVTDARDGAPSPDGDLYAVVLGGETLDRLGVVDAGLTTLTALLGVEDGLTSFRLPQFSPDGAWIAVLASGEGPAVSSRPLGALNGVQDIWLIRPDGSGLQRITAVREDQPDFAWSSDGRHILMRGTFAAYLVDVGERTTQILGAGEFHGWHDWRGNAASEPAPDTQ